MVIKKFLKKHFQYNFFDTFILSEDAVLRRLFFKSNIKEAIQSLSECNVCEQCNHKHETSTSVLLHLANTNLDYLRSIPHHFTLKLYHILFKAVCPFLGAQYQMKP